MKKSDKILQTKEDIMAFMGVQKVLFSHLMKLGLPVVTINGRLYAHSEVLEDWIREKFMVQQSIDIPE